MNSAAYIDGWRRKISNDPKLVVMAAQQAQKAADLILGPELTAQCQMARLANLTRRA